MGAKRRKKLHTAAKNKMAGEKRIAYSLLQVLKNLNMHCDARDQREKHKQNKNDLKLMIRLPMGSGATPEEVFEERIELMIAILATAGFGRRRECQETPHICQR